MTPRDRNLIAVILAAVAVVIAWLMIISPARDKASKLGAQVDAIQSQLDAARAQLSANQAAKSSFAVEYTSLARLGEAVPTDDNVPSLIYQVQGAASAAHVDFRSLVLNAGAGGGSAAPPAPGAGAAPGALPPGATVGPAGFPVEPFTFTFRGSFFRLSDFLGRLQRFVVANNRTVRVSGRLMTLNAISLGPGPHGFPQITASVNATTYLLPAAQGLLNGASSAGPAPSGTQPVSTSASSSSAPVATVTP